jgi:hypothetical protein
MIQNFNDSQIQSSSPNIDLPDQAFNLFSSHANRLTTTHASHKQTVDLPHRPTNFHQIISYFNSSIAAKNSYLQSKSLSASKASVEFMYNLRSAVAQHPMADRFLIFFQNTHPRLIPFSTRASRFFARKHSDLPTHS